MKDLGAWIAAGRIKDQVDIYEGLNAPGRYAAVLGKNRGKQLLKVADQ